MNQPWMYTLVNFTVCELYLNKDIYKIQKIKKNKKCVYDIICNNKNPEGFSYIKYV